MNCHNGTCRVIITQLKTWGGYNRKKAGSQLQTEPDSAVTVLFCYNSRSLVNKTFFEVIHKS